MTKKVYGQYEYIRIAFIAINKNMKVKVVYCFYSKLLIDLKFLHVETSERFDSFELPEISHSGKG